MVASFKLAWLGWQTYHGTDTDIVKLSVNAYNILFGKHNAMVFALWALHQEHVAHILNQVLAMHITWPGYLPIWSNVDNWRYAETGD